MTIRRYFLLTADKHAVKVRLPLVVLVLLHAPVGHTAQETRDVQSVTKSFSQSLAATASTAPRSSLYNPPSAHIIESTKIYLITGEEAPASPGAGWGNDDYLLQITTLAAAAPEPTKSLRTAATIAGLQVPGSANYRMVDAEDDGIYETLEVDVDVDITQAGAYRVKGELTKNGLLIASRPIRDTTAPSGANFTAESGRQTITLKFSGELIYQSGQDGLYDLNLSLVDGKSTATLQTPAYDHRAFGAILATITGAHDEGVDENADGLLEGIRVTMDINVRASGNYLLMGYLHKGGERLDSRAHASNVTLAAGQQHYSLVLPGLPLRRSGLDGPYEAKVSLVESGDESGRSEESFRFNTQPYRGGDFEAVFELTDGSVADEAVDNNGNGLFDALNVNVEATFTHGGTYLLENELHNAARTRALWTTGQLITVTPGKQQLNLTFVGSQIFEQQLDGPYSIDVTLRDLATRETLDHLPLPQETKPYQYTEFDPDLPPPPAIALTGATSDQGVDTDADGAFNQLQVSVGAKLTVGGTYDWSANLVDAGGTEIGFYTRQAYLGAGETQINFVFDGTKVGQNGKNGPYYVKDLLMFGPSGSNLVSFDVATTKAYNASEFEGYVPPKIRGDLNGDGKVDELDLAVLKQAFGSKVGAPEYSPDADLNSDGRINGKDQKILRDLINN